MHDPRQFNLGAIPLFEKDNTHPHIMSVLEKSDIPIPLTPPSADFDRYYGPVKTQIATPCCVGFAFSYKVAEDIKFLFGSDVDISALGLYNGSKIIDGNTGEGTYAPTCAAWLQQHGALIENDFPFDETKVATGIPSTVRQTTEYRIDSYGVHYTLADLKLAIATFGGALLTLAVTPTFDYPRDGVIDYDPNQTSIRGYHEVCATGYDDATGRIRIINSWDSWWSDRGWAWLTYDYHNHFVSNSVSIVPNLTNKIVGDENGDSYVNVLDAYIAMRFAARMKSQAGYPARVADVNGDGKIDIRDALAILRAAAGAAM